MNAVAEAPFTTRTYTGALADFLTHFDWSPVDRLAERIRQLWTEDRQLFLCGNGGSAANALHLANDLLYGVAPAGRAIRADCLCANSSVLTCLANDTGFENVFALQLRAKALAGDGLIVFSGSGNSANILHAVAEARKMGVWTCGILGFSGGAALHLVDDVIHFPLDDMELSEDLQMVVGHSIKRILRAAAKGPGQ
ncbi:MAG: SIS domain-containing protein [Opitutaceae bacterium]|nr:SIS domain-containing protein [Opitutaceae bacterium]